MIKYSTSSIRGSITVYSSSREATAIRFDALLGSINASLHDTADCWIEPCSLDDDSRPQFQSKAVTHVLDVRMCTDACLSEEDGRQEYLLDAVNHIEEYVKELVQDDPQFLEIEFDIGSYDAEIEASFEPEGF